MKYCNFKKKNRSEKPSFVIVNQPEKQFPAIGGVLAETSLNSTGSSGANTSFGSPQAMNLLQDQLKAVRLDNGTIVLPML